MLFKCVPLLAHPLPLDFGGYDWILHLRNPVHWPECHFVTQYQDHQSGMFKSWYYTNISSNHPFSLWITILFPFMFVYLSFPFWKSPILVWILLWLGPIPVQLHFLCSLCLHMDFLSSLCLAPIHWTCSNNFCFLPFLLVFINLVDFLGSALWIAYLQVQY